MLRLLSVFIVFNLLSVAAAQQAQLPAGAIRRLGSDEWRHGSRITFARFSPDGRLLASGGGNDPVRIWDASGKQVQELKDPWVNDLVFSSRGNRAVTVSAFKTIREWDVASGTIVAELKGHEAAVTAIALTRDNTLLATADQAGAVIVWELFLSPRQLHRLSEHSGEVNALAFSPDGRTMASASSDRSIRLWNADTGAALVTLDGGCRATALVFLPDGRLASAGDDQQIRVWDASAGKQLAAWTGHRDTIVSLVLSADGRTLVSGSHDKTMRLWNIADGKVLRTISRDSGDGDALALSPDARTLVSAGTNNTIRRWDVSTGAELQPAPAHRSPITGMALSADGKLLASAGRSGDVRLWDLQKVAQLRLWQRGATMSGDLRLAFSPDGQTLAAATELNGVFLWQVAGGAEPGHIPADATDAILSLAFANDGKSLAIGHHSGKVRISPVGQAFQPAGKLESPPHFNYPGPVYALAYSHDGGMLAASGGKEVLLWEVASGRELRQMAPKESALLPAVACVAFAPDGGVLATGSFDSIIRLWDCSTGQLLRSIEGHTSAVQALAFSADGRRLASAGFDGTARLWETHGGRAVAMWRGHRGPLSSVLISNDGRTIITGSADTSILMWDVTGKSPAGKLPMVQLAAADLRMLWQQLASLNAAEANGAVWDLVRGGRDGVPFAQTSIFLLDQLRLNQLILDLDSMMFLVREKASGELAKYGRWIEPALEDRLKEPGSEELRRRILRLLDRMKESGALTHEQEVLRFRRVMLALEQDGGPAAIGLLQKMSTNAPESYLQAEARASLQRLQAPMR